MEPGDLVRRVRLGQGLRQSELARRAGTTQTYISRIERAAASPSIRTLERLLHAMGQRLAVHTEPLPHGNASARELRADLRDLTAAERVEQAMELSAFLTDAAASASESRRASGGTRQRT